MQTVRYVLQELYGEVPLHIVADGDTLPQYAAPYSGCVPRHAGLSRVMRIVLAPTVVIIIQDVSLQNLSTLCRFHSKSSLTFPTLGHEMGLAAKDQRMRYICYQIIHTVSFLHSLGLSLDPISMASIEVDNDLWVTLLPALSSRMISTGDVRKVFCRRPSAPQAPAEFIPVSPDIQSPEVNDVYDSDDEMDAYVYMKMEKSVVSSRRGGSFISNVGVAIEGSGGDTLPMLSLTTMYYSYGTRYVDKPPGYDVPITLRWIEGKISNFEYIMAINYAAGRRLSDVQHHPVLPWVTDFSVDPTQGYYDENALRDLTRTKFRLSKGDRQLETTFQHSEPPHHIPEVLAELTYTIYMARRVPMHVLQKVVRSYFVPEHYPFSMNRMYEWSPDECIPEFFMDPTVFESIHKEAGLSDIQLPDFAPTPHQFIRYHRSILESNFVSANIHHWIDLTFGCGLTGQRSIDNLNVPLQHSRTVSEDTGGTPDLSKHPGFVVIFNNPHPKRCLDDSGDGLFDLFYSDSTPALKNYAVKKTNSELELKDSMKDYSSLLSFESDVSKAVNMRIASAALAKPPVEDQLSGALSTSPSSGPNPLSAMHMSIFDIAKHDKGVAEPLVATPDKSLSDKGNDNTLDAWVLKATKDIVVSEKCAKELLDVSLKVRATDSMMFASQHAARLEPAVCFPFDIDPMAELSSGELSGYDKEFFSELESLGTELRLQYSTFADLDRSAAEVALASLETLQAIDITFLGLIFSDIFGGWPLCSVQDAIENAKPENATLRTLQRIIYNDKRHAALPMCIKRLLVLLLNPNEFARPTSAEVLSSCMMADRASNKEEEGFLSPPILSNNNNSKLQRELSEDSEPSSEFMAAHDLFVRKSSIARSNFLRRHCGSLFPSFFSTIHTFVCRLKLAATEEQKILDLINNLDLLESLPLDGVSLVLPHVLQCISSARPYLDDEKSNHERALKKKTVKDLLIIKYPKIVDTLAARLGVSGTTVHIFPAVINFLESLHSPSLLIEILRGDLFQVLVQRAGARCFLRSVLPLLITLMISGSLQSLLSNKRQSIYQAGSVPLWASMEQESFELIEWLIHTVSKVEIQKVQDAATAAISSLGHQRSMGPALCLRFVLPAVLCLVCNPSLAVTGYYTEPLAAEYHKHEMNKSGARFARRGPNSDSGKDDSDSDDPHSGNASPSIASTIDLKNDAIDALSIYDTEHMYAVRALEEICQHSGVAATIELILPHLLQNVFPKLEKYYDSPNRQSSAAMNACILELVSIVGGMLPFMSPTVVVNNFFLMQKSTGFCLLNMLVDLPMPPCAVLYRRHKSTERQHSDTSASAVSVRSSEEIVELALGDDDDSDRFNELLHFFRSYRAFLELCKLVTTLASHVGRELCLEHVIPVVNKFFGNFVSSFSGLPVMSLAMSHAFNIAVQLFIPLVQIIGPEAFSTSVYNLNPRLEVWLHSLAFEKVSKSPPLPSNILPEVVTESEKKAESREGRLSRFLQWMTPASSEKERTSGSGSVVGTPAPSTRPGVKSFISDSGSSHEGLRQASGEFDIKYDIPGSDDVGNRMNSQDENGDSEELQADSVQGPVLGISSKLQKHSDDSSKDPAHARTPKKSGSGKRGSNIFQGLSGQISVGGNYSHMFGVDPGDYDAALLLTGMHRWRSAIDESTALSGQSRLPGGGDSNSSKRGGASSGRSGRSGSVSVGAAAIALNLNAGLTNSRRAVAPAAQLSMTAPKITVDTASEAGSLFSLSMVNKVQFYPDEVGVPVKLMVTNNVESLLLTGHRNGRVKVFNLNAHPLCTEATYNGHFVQSMSDSTKSKDDKHQLWGGVFCGGFLRDSAHAFTCDGSVRVWDVETQKNIAEHNAPAFSESTSSISFSFCSGVSPQDCVLPDIGPHGDDILMATMGNTLNLFDVRVRMKNNLSTVAEWRLPVPSASNSSGNNANSLSETTRYDL